MPPKKPFKPELLDELAECIFGYKTVEELHGKTFTGAWIKENGALKKYIEKDFTPRIAESEVLKQCYGLQIPYNKLKDLNVVNIFKKLLKKYTPYILSSSWHVASGSPLYYITPKQQLTTAL